MNFYEVLFEPDELVCWSYDLYGTNLFSVSEASFIGANFFSINPLTKKRSDANVTALRNILVEFDSGTISEQQELLRQCGLPYSTLVYSGGKSLHAIISLNQPICTEAYYRAIVKKIYKKLPTADQKTFNPSRFSRAPGAIRENGKEQKLYEVKGRVPLNDLLAWIGPIEPINHPPQLIRSDKLLPIRVKAFLKYGAPEGLRNATLFNNACEMFRAGFEEAEVIDLVLNSALDLPHKEIMTCIRSARTKVR